MFEVRYFGVCSGASYLVPSLVLQSTAISVSRPTEQVHTSQTDARFMVLYMFEEFRLMYSTRTPFVSKLLQRTKKFPKKFGMNVFISKWVAVEILHFLSPQDYFHN